MYTPLPPRRAFLLAAPAAVLAALPLAAQQAVPDSTAMTVGPVHFSSADLTTLLVIVACGAAGALAADLVADGGHLDRWKSDVQGWTLGFLGKLIVGSIAAVVVLTMNPPEGSWSLLGSALGAGVGGEAILLAIIASRKAQSAEKDVVQAEDLTSRVAVLSQTRMFAMADAMTAARTPAAAHAGAGGWSDETASRDGGIRGLGGAGADGDDGAATRVMDVLADHFSREIAMFASSPRTRRPGSPRDRVRSILVEVLNREDVDGPPLRELGVDRPAVLRTIAQELALEFPRSQPPYRPGDVRAEHTLDTLTQDVQGRQG